ncbi:MAG: endonuclease/exonuclease/phosphatase family protein [Treponema sp.]|nr:endonuclease/exonuclease/phosphatase family protein [Spirochaetia bacterium]MDY2839245.1 endonuclease/exonuclease/phosphatase family protein [Treponema sp.]
MKDFSFYVLFFLMMITTSCHLQSCGSANSDSGENKIVSVVSWNVQTFFDAQLTGNEYADFQSMTKWSRDKYIERLKRLVEVMELLDSDIYVFEEIENQGVLYDIFNQLAGRAWSGNNNWTYGSFAQDDNECIGIGILSKFPIENAVIHKMDVRTQNSKQPSSRPLLQATILINDKKLNILANHWKSKSGGEENSEIWRDWQENILAKVLSTLPENENYLICGDFNRDILDFKTDFLNEKGNVLLRFYSIAENKSKTIPVWSPWFNDGGTLTTEKGTYYYQKKWERIDNFLSFGSSILTSFSEKADLPWADEDGIPLSYKINSGEGYSDHLPIMTCVILQ